MVGKEFKKKQPRKKDGTFDSVENNRLKRKIGAMFFVVATAFVLLGIIKATLWANEWSSRNVIRTQSPIAFHKPIWVEPVPEKVVISPFVEEAETLEVDGSIERRILDLWGERYFLLMTSVFKCESGLRPDAVNWGSKDLGVAQINWPTWEKPVKEKFGYTLADMFDADKNLEVAYWIWDRADGTEGDGKGSAEPWVVYNNGTFRGCVE